MNAPDLLAELLGDGAWSGATAAKAAKAGESQASMRVGSRFDPCEHVRKAANSAAGGAALGVDSQEFAALRSPTKRQEREHPCGFSQDSQDSQRSRPTMAIGTDALAAVTWTDADKSAFLTRRNRLLRWGWPKPEAERLAGRLVRRDREQDERVSCTDCHHHRPGRCGNHRHAGLTTAEVGRDLAAMLQRCPGYRRAP